VRAGTSPKSLAFHNPRHRRGVSRFLWLSGYPSHGLRGMTAVSSPKYFSLIVSRSCGKPPPAVAWTNAESLEGRSDVSKGAPMLMNGASGFESPSLRFIDFRSRGHRTSNLAGCQAKTLRAPNVTLNTDRSVLAKASRRNPGDLTDSQSVCSRPCLPNPELESAPPNVLHSDRPAAGSRPFSGLTNRYSISPTSAPPDMARVPARAPNSVLRREQNEFSRAIR
jgi:hypothetical protein